MNKPMPAQTAPPLSVPTTDGKTWDLSQQKPENFTLIVFYRGLHCPICKDYLQNLNTKVEEFQKLGVIPIAISGDPEDVAKKTADEWKLDKFPLGYGQSIDSMREWGLYISHKIKEEEPDEFGEPGLFLVKPDQTIYYAAINSMPFGRPHIQDMLDTVGFVISKGYPPRGDA